MRLYKMNGVFAAFFVLCGIGLACELLPGEGTVSKALQFSVASNLQKQKLHEVDVERKASISFMKDLQTVEEFQKKLEVHLAEILPMPTVLVAMIAQYCKPLTFALKKKWKASEHGIFTVSCSSDGKMFASAGSGGAVTFWDMHTLQKLKSMSRPDGRQVCFSTFLSPNSFLLSGDEGGDAYMGDYDKEQFVATMGLDGGKLLNVSCPAKK